MRSGIWRLNRPDQRIGAKMTPQPGRLFQPSAAPIFVAGCCPQKLATGSSRLMQRSARDDIRGAIRRELAPRRRDGHPECDGHWRNGARRSCGGSAIPDPGLVCGRPRLWCATHSRSRRRTCRSFSGITKRDQAMRPDGTTRRLAAVDPLSIDVQDDRFAAGVVNSLRIVTGSTFCGPHVY